MKVGQDEVLLKDTILVEESLVDNMISTCYFNPSVLYRVTTLNPQWISCFYNLYSYLIFFFFGGSSIRQKKKSINYMRRL